MTTASLRNAVDSRSVQKLVETDQAGNVLSGTGYRLTTYAQPTVQSATPVAWTTGNSPVTLWTVTGTVLARVFGLTGATQLTSTSNTGTLSIGVVNSVQLFLPTTTANGSTNYIASSVWVDNAPTVLGKVLVAGNLTWAIVNGTPITLTVATNSMTAGAMTLYCQWIPLTTGATVV